MKIARRMAAVAGALALGSGLAVVAAPADAAPEATPVVTPVVTVTVTDYSNPTHPRYGDFVGVTAGARGPHGEYLTGGDVRIQMAPAGSSVWQDVGDGVGTFTSYSLAALVGPVQFRATYSGGTSGAPAVTYPAVTSTPAVIGAVDRGTRVVRSTRKQVCYRVGPAPYRNKVITSYVKRGQDTRWRPAGTVETNDKSTYCYAVDQRETTSTGNRKGPQVKGRKTVYVSSGGMAGSVVIRTR